MTNPLVDYHCHLDLYGDHEVVFGAARTSGAEIFAVTTTPLAWARNNELSGGAPNLRIGLGLHPQLIGKPVADLKVFSELVKDARFIGEVGLDAGPIYYKSLEAQKDSFSEVLRLCAAAAPKILSLHCVRAHKQLFDLIDRHWHDSAGTLVLHWFSGGQIDAKRALERGCYFSINPATESSATGSRVLEILPIDRLLTETDGPFTTSSPKTPRSPGDVMSAVRFIARIKKMRAVDVQAQVWHNLRKIEAALGI
jgi:TatD DNase family protein